MNVQFGNFCFTNSNWTITARKQPKRFELGHNVMEAIKNICCVKDEDVVDHRWFKKFHSGYNNLDHQIGLKGCILRPCSKLNYASRTTKILLNF